MNRLRSRFILAGLALGILALAGYGVNALLPRQSLTGSEAWDRRDDLMRQKTNDTWQTVVPATILATLPASKQNQPINETLTAPAPSRTPDIAPHGTVDLSAYCQARGFPDATLVENNVNGWRCIDIHNQQRPIDFRDVCLQRYGVGEPEFRDLNDPNSWTCTLP